MGGGTSAGLWGLGAQSPGRLKLLPEADLRAGSWAHAHGRGDFCLRIPHPRFWGEKKAWLGHLHFTDGETEAGQGRPEDPRTS